MSASKAFNNLCSVNYKPWQCQLIKQGLSPAGAPFHMPNRGGWRDHLFLSVNYKPQQCQLLKQRLPPAGPPFHMPNRSWMDHFFNFFFLKCQLLTLTVSITNRGVLKTVVVIDRTVRQGLAYLNHLRATYLRLFRFEYGRQRESNPAPCTVVGYGFFAD